MLVFADVFGNPNRQLIEDVEVDVEVRSNSTVHHPPAINDQWETRS
ncbi:hypothetical protein [Amycolatopsis sp. H20-H5]|nr:hypothetical protein [Amycolatopsis sp. H20-H5]MEC3978020.1 hypothetical protein [Amycolatopsis sp. H20-H5]